jgi:hypothetical protein
MQGWHARTFVIDFYRRPGYTEIEPPVEAPDPMVYMQRPANP